MTIDAFRRTIAVVDIECSGVGVTTCDAKVAVKELRGCLYRRDHVAFLARFNTSPLSLRAEFDDYLKALGGEALCVLLDEEPEPPPQVLRDYAALLLKDKLLLPFGVAESLAEQLKSKPLRIAAERLKIRESRGPRTKRKVQQAPTLPNCVAAPVIEVSRFVQSTYMSFAPSLAETAGLRTSIFGSEQEKSFNQALALRFPAFLALPNYPLDQIVDLFKLRKVLGDTHWHYAKNCRIDSVLVLPGAGRALAAFELDSAFHDGPEARLRDGMKDAIFSLLGMPYFRLRVENPGTVNCDDWYAVLTTEVVPRLDFDRVLQVASTRR